MTGKDLKNSILQLAIQGKLVPQNPNDEPASELLARIRQEKERLVKEKKLKKKDLETTPITDEEKPFEIPENWEWVRMNDIADYRKGPFGSSLTKSMFVPKSVNSIKVYEQKNAIQKDYRLGEYYISQDKFETMKGFAVCEGDIIVSCAGTIGESYQIPINAPIGIINQALMRVRLFEKTMADYWRLFFADMLNHNADMKGSGSAIKNIPPFEVLKNIAMPIPPLAEQQRIVAKIEELMPLVEEYDKNEQKLEALNKALPERLRQSVLQQAIMGKLVPQDENDEPASELLARIRKEKERLVKEKKLKKKDLETTPVTDEEKPFEIPESWEWCRMRNLCNFASVNKKDAQHICLDARYLRGKSEGTLMQGGNYVNKGKYIILVDGENSGEVFVTPCEGFLGSTFKELIITDEISFDYLKYIFMIIKEELRLNKRGAAIPHLDKILFFEHLIPLPPLAEQQRIVAKIEELFSVIDNLKTC